MKPTTSVENPPKAEGSTAAPHLRQRMALRVQRHLVREAVDGVQFPVGNARPDDCPFCHRSLGRKLRRRRIGRATFLSHSMRSCLPTRWLHQIHC
jgi:hypothetical protein